MTGPSACYELSRRRRSIPARKVRTLGTPVCGRNRARPGPPRTGLRPWGGDEAESEGCGGSTVEDDNEVWPDLRRNPEGWGQFSSFLRHASLEDSPYSSLLTPRTEKNWLPAPPAGKFITGSRLTTHESPVRPRDLRGAGAPLGICACRKSSELRRGTKISLRANSDSALRIVCSLRASGAPVSDREELPNP
jgi:hypothetical protein